MKLVVSDLSIARGGVPVLQAVSFVAAAGEALVLRGPNGIGKTTLLRAVAGLQPALSGQVGPTRDMMAYSGHADGVKSQLSVRENLNFWAEIFGTRATEAALETYDLTALAGRLAGGLSAGQKRRLGLARMMVTGRAIWIMDEPTVSLDQRAVSMFAGAVQSHLSAGGIAVMATHIDLGLPQARVVDLSPFKATVAQSDAFDEAFL